jgi:hypothetical protein
MHAQHLSYLPRIFSVSISSLRSRSLNAISSYARARYAYKKEQA